MISVFDAVRLHAYLTDMSGIILGTHRAERVARPSSAEVAIIGYYVEQQEALEEFRHDIGYWMHQVGQDVNEAVPAAYNLFRARSADVEHLLSAEGMEPWTPARRQPRLLARSLPTTRAATEFTARAFESRTMIGAGSNERSQSDNRLREFLCAMFWEEVRLVLKSERDLSGREFFDVLLHSKPMENNVEGNADEYFRINKHRLIYDFWHDSSWNEPHEGIHSISYIRNDDLVGRGRYYADRSSRILHDTAPVLTARDWSVEQSKRSLHVQKFSRTIEKFRESIDKNLQVSVFYFRNTSEIEKEIFGNIVDNSGSAANYIDEIHGVGYSELLRREEFIDATNTDPFILLDEFAKANPGKPVSSLVRELLPMLQNRSSDAASVALPTEAPETYQGLRGPETPPEFVKRVYGEWLGHGLTRADIRKLDPKLAVAINNWLSRPGNEWPADVDLPTLKEQNTRWVERVKEGSAEGLTLREARRLEGVLHRRKASGRE